MINMTHGGLGGSMKNTIVAILCFVMMACSSSEVYTYNDSNQAYSPQPGEYYPGTLTEFITIYQEVKNNPKCSRYINDPTFVYTCESESLVITNTGRAGRYITFCAYWSSSNKEYCSQGSQSRW